jgi:GntR family negative regulator for fad regulon and positive regulator of fabA
MDWQSVQKPAEIAENRLLEAILSGHFPVNSSLPGERDLAGQIGVTRPTLREALQRLARDGWLDIQHGRPTRVRDYWREGNLAVLSVLARHPAQQSPAFVDHLLALRILLAPTYAHQAVDNSAQAVAAYLETCQNLEDAPAVYARADWDLHCLLTQQADNPVFRLLLNGFHDLYLMMGEQYFSYAACRQHSSAYYRDLLACARRREAAQAGDLTRRIMEQSLELWKQMQAA